MKVMETVTTREQWRERALELAEARHLDGTARLVSESELARVYRIPNGDRRGEGYLVRFTLRRQEPHCECPAGAWGKPCGHAGAALHAEQLREAARRDRSPSEAWSWWLRGGEW